MKKKIIVTLFTIILIGSAVSAQAETVIPQIGGYVYSEFSNEPLPGVKIYLIDRGLEVETDSKGKFRISGEFRSGEKLSMDFYHHCCKAWQIRISVAADGDLGRIKLPYAPKNILYFLVKEKCDKLKLIPDVEVSSSFLTKTTNEHGKLNIEITDPDQLNGSIPIVISFKKPGYIDEVVEMRYSPGNRFMEIKMRPVEGCDVGPTPKEPCLKKVYEQLSYLKKTLNEAFPGSEKKVIGFGSNVDFLDEKILIHLNAIIENGADLTLSYPASGQVSESLKISFGEKRSFSLRDQPADIYFQVQIEKGGNQEILFSLNKNMDMTLSNYKSHLISICGQ